MAKRQTKRKNYRKSRKSMRGGMVPLPANGEVMAPVFYNGQEIPAIPHDENDGHDLDGEDWGNWGDELNVSQSSSNPNTTVDSGLTANMQDELNAHMMNDHSFSSFGTDQSPDQSLSTISGNSDNSLDMSQGSDIFDEDLDQNGGKRKKSKKRRKLVKKGGKTRKIRRRRRQRGGVCYGNGVGANNYDPNYSIYNTNLTKLFPYKPQ